MCVLFKLDYSFFLIAYRSTMSVSQKTNSKCFQVQLHPDYGIDPM